METNSKEREARGTESLPKETVERIEREADERYGKCAPGSKDMRTRLRQKDYIAGATCEALRAREEMRVEKLQHEDTFLKMMEARGRISELEAEIINLKADKSMQKDNL